MNSKPQPKITAPSVNPNHPVTNNVSVSPKQATVSSSQPDKENQQKESGDFNATEKMSLTKDESSSDSNGSSTERNLKALFESLVKKETDDDGSTCSGESGEDSDSQNDMSEDSKSTSNNTDSGKDNGSGSSKGSVTDSICTSSNRSNGRKRARSPAQVAKVKRCRRMKANDRERNR